MDPEDDDYEDERAWELEDEFECPADFLNGYCPLAGTEECDWDCPNN